MATLTVQQLFSSAMLALMAELKGGDLKKFCETKTQKGGESITFNRLGESSAAAGAVPSMYGDDFAGTGGDMKAFKAVIEEIYAQDKVKVSDLAKTTIDIKNGYVKSLGNAVNRKEDLTIIDKVEAAIGVKEEVIADYETDIKKIVKAIRTAKAYASATPDNHTGVALVLTPENWAALSTSELAMSADYANVFGGGSNGEPSTFYGAEVILVKGLVNGLVIPSNTICFGEWEGSMEAIAEYNGTDGRAWHLQAVKSVGAVVAEPTMITKLTSGVVRTKK